MATVILILDDQGEQVGTISWDDSRQTVSIQSTEGIDLITNNNGDIQNITNGSGSTVINGLRFPQNDGSHGQVVVTDGNGNLSFVTLPVGNTVALGDLADIDLSNGLDDGWFLTYSVADNAWVATPQLSSIGDVGDMNITNVSDGQFLQYNEVTSAWENVTIAAPGAPALGELTDVELTNEQEGQVPVYRAGKWVNEDQTGSDEIPSFLDLPDTPTDYTGQAEKGIKVNSTEDGVEFFTRTPAPVDSVDGRTGEVTLDDLYAAEAHTHVKSEITDFNDADYATSAQGALADTAIQPSDNLSELTNDSGFISDAPSDTKQYGRKDGAWAEITETGGGSGSLIDDPDPTLGSDLKTAGFNIITPDSTPGSVVFNIGPVGTGPSLNLGNDGTRNIISTDSIISSTAPPANDSDLINKQFADATYLNNPATATLNMNNNPISGVTTTTFAGGMIVAENFIDGNNGPIFFTSGPLSFTSDGSTVDIRYPSTDGTPTQVLTTDGAGTSSWSDVPDPDLDFGTFEGEDAGNFVGFLTEVRDDQAPVLGGSLDTNGNNITSSSGALLLNNFSFPSVDGTDGQSLVTNGAGGLEFRTISGAFSSSDVNLSTPVLDDVLAFTSNNRWENVPLADISASSVLSSLITQTGGGQELMQFIVDAIEEKLLSQQRVVKNITVKPADPEIGDQYYDISKNSLMIWAGARWLDTKGNAH